MTCRSRWIVILFFTLFAASAAAQVGREENQASNRSQKAGVTTDPPAPAPAAISPSSYVIGIEDVLDISIWKEPEISRTVPVRFDGKISLPLLHDVQASGLTPVQLGAEIAKELKRFFTDPQVTVIVTAMNSQKVYILGEVRHPGPVPLVPNMTVLQVLSVAGGLSQYANEKKIYVLRVDNGRETRLPYDYRQAVEGRGSARNIVLQPGDTIVVP